MEKRKQGRPRKGTRKYDQPPEGYQRYTTFVRQKLLNDFKGVCTKEEKTYTQGIEEALENWTYVENDD